MVGTIRSRRRLRLVTVVLAAMLVPTAGAGQSPSPAAESAPAATFVWASHGDPADPMENTSGVTIAPDGNLWVADTGHGRFAIFHPDGTFIEYWGTEGRGPGEFVLHRANDDGYANVAFAPDGSFFVLNSGTRRIMHFAADRTFVGEWGGFGSEPGQFANPASIAVDADGSVLVVDDVRDVVERLTPDGTVLSTFEAVPPGVGINWMALGADGHIYVSTFNPKATILHYDPTGTLIWMSPDLSIDGGPDDQATGMAVDAAGRVFTGGIPETTPDRIRVVGPDGDFVARFGGTGDAPEDVGFPFALALDGHGGLYVTDYLDGSIKKFQLGPELVASASATAGWSMFKGDAARRGEGSDGPLGEPALRWRFQARGAVPEQVSLGGDLALASSDDGVLHALDVTTGEERWSFATDEPPFSGPVLDDGSVYVFDGVGNLHAVDAATGEERWRSASQVAGPSSATAGDGVVYVGSEGGELVAIEAVTGAERWRTSVSATGGQVHSPAFSSGRVYVTSEGGGYVAVEAADGSFVWRFDTGDLSTGTAVVADGIAFVGGSGDDGTGMLWALDAVTGAELWRVEQALGNPAVSGGVAFSGSARGVTAVDAATGARLWTFPVEGYVRPLAVADGVVYVPADAEHRIYALDAATGVELWQFDVDSGIDCCIAVGSGAVYVGTWLGSVYAIEGRGTL